MSAIVPKGMFNVLIFGAIFSLSQTACSRPVKKIGDYDCSELVESFFYGRSVSDRINDFAKHPVEKQFAIFVCGNQVIHPPPLYLVTPLANNGGGLVDLLIGELLEARDDLIIRDIVFIVSEMSRLRTYEARRNVRLMSIMEMRVKGMRNPDWKSVTEKMLGEVAY